MLMTVVWFSFFVHAAAETCQFPQPAQDSVAILLKTVLQVSYEETSYMGKLQVTDTWNVSLQISQIINGRPRSTKVKDKANQRVQRWHVTVLST